MLQSVRCEPCNPCAALTGLRSTPTRNARRFSSGMVCMSAFQQLLPGAEPGEPAGGPRGLQVEAAREAVDVQHLAAEEKTRDDPRLHCPLFHEVQLDAACGDDLALPFG